jgi:hypothetical protein
MSRFQYGSIVQGTTSTATAAGTTTLVNTSSQIQNFTGTAIQTIVLPNATTMSNGQSFEIYNSSTGALTVNKNGGSLISNVASNIALVVKLTDNSSAAGIWVVQSSASTGGSAGVNYIVDTDGSAIGAWVTYADAAATSPVDGTGGAPTVTYAVSTNSDLRGTSNFLFTHDAVNRQGEGFSYAFTIDPSDKGKVLQIATEYKIASGTYADDDLQFWIYDVTNAALIQPAPFKLKNSGIVEKFAMEFQTSSSSTSYRLIGHVATATATAYTIRFDTWSLGPQAKLYGSPIVDDKALTTLTTPATTLTNFGNGTAALTYARQGNRIKMQGVLIVGSSLPTGSITFTLPTGLSADYSTVPKGIGNADAYQAVGIAQSYTPYFSGIIIRNNASTTQFQINGDGTVYGTGDNGWTATIPQTWAAGDTISIDLEVPIIGWSSSVVMSSDAATNVVTFAASVNSATSLTDNAYTKVAFTTLTKDSSGGYSTANSTYTIPVAGSYRFSGYTESAAYGAASTVIGSIFINGTGSNVGFRANGTTLAVLEQNWTVKLDDLKAGDIVDFRIYQNSGGAVSIGAAGRGGFVFKGERISGPAQIAASSIIAASTSHAGSQSLTNATWTTLQWNTKVYDRQSAMNLSTYIYPIQSAGIYTISGFVGFATNATGTRAIGYVKNGAAVTPIVGIPALADFERVPFTMDLDLIAGDTITVQAYQSSGGALNTADSVFNIKRLGGI